MNVELTGRIAQILPLEQGLSKAGNAWRKQVFILETQDQYPRKVAISLLNDNIDKIPVQVGAVVTANLEIESREWNAKWYTEVKAWQITYPQGQPVAPATQPTTQAYTQQAYTQQAYTQQVATPAPAQPQAAEDLPF